MVVIGGSAGIGFETARRARTEDAKLILIARNNERLKRAATELDARRERLRTALPIRRVFGPDDIAALAVDLMSNTAVTEATFDIDGGQQFVEG